MRLKMRKFARNRYFVNDQQGLALILVLLILMLLTALASELAFSTRTEYNLTSNSIQEKQAYFIALAGYQMALAQIMTEYDYVYRDNEGNLVFANRGSGKESRTLRAAGFDIPLGPGIFSYWITDEDSKININAIKRNKLHLLLEETGIEGSQRDNLADSILDWRDADTVPRLKGAEDDYYRGLPQPYESKDGSFDTIEELLLVKGVTPEIFYGSKSAEDGQGYRGISQFLTVQPRGVNRNTAEEIVLKVAFGEEKAERIVSQRSTKNGVFRDRDTSKSFTIIATGQINNTPIRRAIKAIVTKEVTRQEQRVKIIYWNDNYLSGGVSF
ncbi:MAG: hypothetical protein V3S39_01895 [Thermodesulfobacteriota bacterium]